MRNDVTTWVEQGRALTEQVIKNANGSDAERIAQQREAVERSLSDFKRLDLQIPPELATLLETLRTRDEENARAREELDYLFRAVDDLRSLLSDARPAPQVDKTQRRVRLQRRGTSGRAMGRARGFVLHGRHYPAETWIGLLIDFAQLMAEHHPQDFQRVLQLRGTKHPYFSRDPNLLRAPHQIQGTQLYLDKHYSAQQIVRIATEVARTFGYSSTEFAILES